MTTFPSFVKKIFSSWTVLRLAEQTSTAGASTKSKIDNLVPFIVDRMTKNVIEENLAEWLEEYLCDNVNVLCEDDSQYGVAKLIVNGYALSSAGKQEDLAQLMAKIPSGCDLQQCSSQTLECEISDDGEDCPESEGDAAVDITESPMDED